MPENQGSRLAFDSRCAIEEMLEGEIAKELGVSPSTVSRKAKANRTFCSSKAFPDCSKPVVRSIRIFFANSFVFFHCNMHICEL